MHRACAGLLCLLATASKSRRTVESIVTPSGSGPVGLSVEARAHKAGRDAKRIVVPASTSDGSSQ